MLLAVEKIGTMAKRLRINKMSNTMHVPVFQGEEFKTRTVMQDVECLDLYGFNLESDIYTLMTSVRRPELPGLKRVRFFRTLSEWMEIDEVTSDEEYGVYTPDVLDVSRALSEIGGRWKMEPISEHFYEWVRLAV